MRVKLRSTLPLANKKINESPKLKADIVSNTKVNGKTQCGNFHVDTN